MKHQHTLEFFLNYPMGIMEYRQIRLGDPSNNCGKKYKRQPHQSSRGKVRGSQTPVGFILWGPRMYAQNFIPIHLIVLGIFLFGNVMIQFLASHLDSEMILN